MGPIFIKRCRNHSFWILQMTKTLDPWSIVIIKQQQLNSSLRSINRPLGYDKVQP